MYSTGDIVVYRHHVCEVTGVREAYFEGRDYLELRALFENALKLFVAVDEVAPPTLRPTMTKQQALALIDSIAGAESIDESDLYGQSDTPSLADRRIKEEYDRHLKTFSPQDLIPIIKSVHERTERREDAGRRITAVDKKYFNLAEGLLCDELSVSLGIPRDEVHDFMVDRIKRAEARK